MTDAMKFRPYTDDEKASLLDPDLVPSLEAEAKKLSKELAELTHEFCHIGDSHDHHPVRVDISFKAISSSTEQVRNLAEVSMHPDTPEDVRDAELALLKVLATAGLVALDLRQVEKNWDDYKNMPAATSNPLVSLIAFLDANTLKGSQD